MTTTTEVISFSLKPVFSFEEEIMIFQIRNNKSTDEGGRRNTRIPLKN